ncbi:MAG: hypothetical protein CSA24_02815 [Deltaproteobacteria bacterium]|nr:MAG: hypothetical protein CSB49_03275 [Pseudomonadota bacterium]PIE65225.1 MAG: hypothetical protein CSA24_02815 [Deltaproteobacteria bacterium]
MVYDRTCRGRPGLPGLSHAWQLGGGLYRWLGRLDAVFPVESWGEAFSWLAQVGAADNRPVAEVQVWGHANWGRARLCDDVFERATLAAPPPGLEALRERLSEGSLFWFRCCETFGARPGQDFAAALADHLGCRVAGHSYIIGWHQSGLHSLAPGQTPSWDPTEGLRAGSPEEPQEALPSRSSAPNTINCLQGAIPKGW